MIYDLPLLLNRQELLDLFEQMLENKRAGGGGGVCVCVCVRGGGADADKRPPCVTANLLNCATNTN